MLIRVWSSESPYQFREFTSIEAYKAEDIDDEYNKEFLHPRLLATMVATMNNPGSTICFQRLKVNTWYFGSIYHGRDSGEVARLVLEKPKEYATSLDLFEDFANGTTRVCTLSVARAMRSLMEAEQAASRSLAMFCMTSRDNLKRMKAIEVATKDSHLILTRFLTFENRPPNNCYFKET
jgi:hypothetical protein